jgi:hypothetical protein
MIMDVECYYLMNILCNVNERPARQANSTYFLHDSIFPQRLGHTTNEKNRCGHVSDFSCWHVGHWGLGTSCP